MKTKMKIKPKVLIEWGRCQRAACMYLLAQTQPFTLLHTRISSFFLYGLPRPYCHCMPLALRPQNPPIAWATRSPALNDRRYLSTASDFQPSTALIWSFESSSFQRSRRASNSQRMTTVFPFKAGCLRHPFHHRRNSCGRHTLAFLIRIN